jgi:outer membrane protein assembly factor BamB
MKTQIANQNSDRTRFRCGMKSSTLHSLAIAVLTLLVMVGYASAQISSCTTGGLGVGGNYCPSPQYRSGATGLFNDFTNTYNANLTGSPVGDSKVLNSSTVGNLALTFTSPQSPSNNCIASGFNPPTSSPSIESRIIFPATDPVSGNCYLYAYGVAGHSLGWTALLDQDSIVSSPGYAGGAIYLATASGNLYQFDFVTGHAGWTFNPGTSTPIDSSPTTWPNLDGVYIADNQGVVYKVNPSSGSLDSTWASNGGPIKSGIYPGGGVHIGTMMPSASSVAVTNCGGLYPACSMLFVAGSPGPSGSGGGIVNAYNSDSGTPAWTTPATTPSAVTSSPVVSDSQGLVYVQTPGAVNCDFPPPSPPGLIYAFDEISGETSGGPDWITYVSCPSIADSFSWYSGSSPAYDESNYRNIGPVVITVTNVTINIYDDTNNTWTSVVWGGQLAVYNAQRAASGGGSLVCSTYIETPTSIQNGIYRKHITQSSSEAVSMIPLNKNPPPPPPPSSPYAQVTQSSPEVVNGVIYIGTDDGYVLAYDEATCGNPPLWTSQQMVMASGAPDPLMSPPVVSFNRVHAVSQSGTLYVWSLVGH